MQVLVSEVVSAHSAAPRADATATSMVPTVTTACWYCVECRRRAAACPGTSPAAVRGEVSEVSDSSELASSRHSSLVMDRQPDACNTNSDSRHSTHIRHSLALDSSVTRRSAPRITITASAICQESAGSPRGSRVRSRRPSSGARSMTCMRARLQGILRADVGPHVRDATVTYSARHRAARSGLWEEVDKPSDSPPPSTTHATAHDSRGSSVADAGVCARAPCEHE